jgi:threonine dehydrogenase-like Zn-dependent dehydrogenase
MRAIVYDGKKVSLRRKYPDPKPGKGELLVEVTHAGICSTDLEIARGYMRFSGVLGHEFVGRVVAGPQAWRGKRVVSDINCVCGKCDMCRSGMANHCRKRTVIGLNGRDGCFADYIVVPERNCHLIPEAVSDEEAVFVEPLAAAYQSLHQVPIEPRMRVAVLGAGRLGLLVAQVLAATQCRLEVISRNSEKLSFCDKKGIRTIPLDELLPKADRDVVIDCTGSSDGLALALRLVRPRGTIVMKTTTADAGQINLTPLVVNEIVLLGSRCGPFPEAINALARKEIDVLSMISRTFPLARGLEALRAAESPQCIKVLLRNKS